MIASIVILLWGAGALLYCTSRWKKLLVVLLIPLIQIGWWGRPQLSSHGGVIEEEYRIRERMTAHRASFENPSPETKAAAEAEDKRLYDYVAKREMFSLALILILDGFVSCYIWTYEARNNPTRLIQSARAFRS